MKLATTRSMRLTVISDYSPSGIMTSSMDANTRDCRLANTLSTACVILLEIYATGAQHPTFGNFPRYSPLHICLTGTGTVMWNPRPISQKSRSWFSQSFDYHASTHTLELRGDVWASTASKTSQAGGIPRPTLRLGVRFCRTSQLTSSTYPGSNGSSSATLRYHLPRNSR